MDAKELLDALKEIASQANYQGFGDPASRCRYMQDIAEAAIAKAEGK